MDFCPNCGKLLRPEDEALVCMKCNYKKELGDEAISYTEEIEHDLERELLRSEVIDETKSAQEGPTKQIFCPECDKIQKVNYWQRQTRSADESPTRFFRCTECGHTWREYD